MLADGASEGAKRNVAMRSADRSRVLVYLAAPATVSVQMDRLQGAKAGATWINPKTGERIGADEHATSGTSAFTTPESWQDALLLLEAR
jgi:hypothetical protein